MNLTDFGRGIAQHLHDQGVAVRAVGREYRDTEVGIYLGEAPSGVSCVALRCYRVSDSMSGQATIGIQATLRGRPKDKAVEPLHILEAALRDALHGAHGIDLLGGIEVTLITFFNSTEPELAPDERWGMTATFYADVFAPGPNLY